MTHPDEDEPPRKSARTKKRDDKQVDRGALGRVTAHVLALEASDHAWDDARVMRREPLLRTIAEQLMKSASAVGAHIADGYGRRSPRDRIRFYEYALTENGEAETWYRNGRHVLPPDVLEERLARLTSIRRLLLTMIKRERGGGGWNDTKGPPNRR
jgi:four helix bundle protein